MKKSNDQRATSDDECSGFRFQVSGFSVHGRKGMSDEQQKTAMSNEQ